MSSPTVSSIASEVERIRAISVRGGHHEALAAAERLAASVPEHRDALYLIATNQRCLGRTPDALATLTQLERHHPQFSLLHQERGHNLLTVRDMTRARDAFERAVTINPALSTSWTILETLYRHAGDIRNASRAAAQLATLKRLPSEIVRAGSLFCDGDLDAAEGILRAHVSAAHPHVEAMRLLARLAHQRGSLDEADAWLAAALKLVPHSRVVVLDYARVLIDRQQYLRAHDVLGPLLDAAPDDGVCLSLHAAACAGLGAYERAIAAYQRLLVASPRSPELRISLGHAFRALGRSEDAIASYRAAADASPGFGDAYWSLANLKTYRFLPEEIERMRIEEAAPAARPIDRCHLCFALGKALEDSERYSESWQFYERGNALKRAERPYRRDVVDAFVREQIDVCTRSFFAERAGSGRPDRDPIFIVGLPRSGSTLVEQILASHSRVESTYELAEIASLANGLSERSPARDERRYPRVLATLSPSDFRTLGDRYLNDTRAYRTGRPFFVDKMPNNFQHVGLMHLMLPNATIIDVRREPMACCVSNLKQLFARGQEFSYGVEDLAHYYRAYLALMQHWDVVLPGRVLRVWYEDVVEQLEPEVRRILSVCGLDFEPACVEFHRTVRPVRTASSEQIRQRLFRDGLSGWRHYEPWLAPLRDGLGDALTRYRE
jgi:tetratricopeptide (TPR) repeat protein